jgi:hypothetical protein
LVFFCRVADNNEYGENKIPALPAARVFITALLELEFDSLIIVDESCFMDFFFIGNYYLV